MLMNTVGLAIKLLRSCGRFCALPYRQRAAASVSVPLTMRDLLQQLDQDYYRAALLLVAHAELEHLRQEPPPGIDVERSRKTPFGVAPGADGGLTKE
jgi:hypothetical protein